VNYFNGAHVSVLGFAEVGTRGHIHLQSGGQTLLDVDGPFRISGIGIETTDLL
jgi:hypothetical protein